MGGRKIFARYLKTCNIIYNIIIKLRYVKIVANDIKIATLKLALDRNL
jgi:hypothetical protein